MAPLDRHSLAAMQDRGAICQHLDLHMAALGEIALHVQRRTPKRRGGFTRRTGVVFGHVLGAPTTRMPRPPPPAAALRRMG